MCTLNFPAVWTQCCS